MENTKISWCLHTMNFWVGCEEVSPACDDCYAKRWAGRAGKPELWQGVRYRTKTWNDPLKFNRLALAAGERHSVFANSLSDFFDNHPDVGPWRADAWKVIADCSALDWYLVTKRIPNVAKMLPPDFTKERFGHVVIIITVVTQAEADRDIPRLVALKQRYPWLLIGLSMEPLLGAVDLRKYLFVGAEGGIDFSYTPRGYLDWVIVGGESGGQARPLKVSWVRSLRDQCLAAGVPFHFKQWGEFHHDGQQWPSGMYGMRETPGVEPEATRVGVKKSGRRLDGRTHDDGPRKVAA